VQIFMDGRRQLANGCMTHHFKDLGAGFHRVRLELVDYRGNRVEGPFNAVERVILLSPEKALPRLKAGAKPPKQPELASIPGAMTMGRPWVSMVEKQAPPPRAATRKAEDSVTVVEEVDTAAVDTPKFTVREPSRAVRRALPVELDRGTEAETAPETEAPAVETPDASRERDAQEEPAPDNGTPVEPRIENRDDAPKITTVSAEQARARALAAEAASTPVTLRTAAVTTTQTVVERVAPAPTLTPQSANAVSTQALAARAAAAKAAAANAAKEAAPKLPRLPARDAAATRTLGHIPGPPPSLAAPASLRAEARQIAEKAAAPAPAAKSAQPSEQEFYIATAPPTGSGRIPNDETSAPAILPVAAVPAGR
jgi:hypothetical protein